MTVTRVRRSTSIAIASLVLGLCVAGGVAACKQGEGERCQTSDDCESPLLCNEGEGVCRESASGGIDALPPEPAPDAAPDAPTADAL